MDSAELKAIQTPLKERYREAPESAVVTLRAVGSVEDQAIACKVETGRALAIAGLHPATGGSGAELCSGDMLLEALVADPPGEGGSVHQIRCMLTETFGPFRMV